MENIHQNAEKTWTSQEEEKMRVMAKRGDSTHQVAVSMGCTDQAVIDKASILKVEFKNHESVAKTELKAEGNTPNIASAKTELKAEASTPNIASAKTELKAEASTPPNTTASAKTEL
jgi:hypothetical protein